ncbi:uncharacterized protein LOC133184661 [Saccostrea echinata]|uniref:uncharacterized protein LOC133184661 n=1 Tax=Saccostrea echinata TaxID=191078 RepID=UPI002A8166BB|nr:uncharacterized protein LOC133184661 [Saccostrea echinata]
MFAEVQISKTRDEKVPRLVEPLVTNIISSGLSSVHHVCCVDSETAWYSGNAPRLKLLDKKSKELKVVKTPDQHGVSGMSMSISRELIFCSSTNKSVYKVKGETIEQICSTGDFKPYGIHCCRNGDILVSVCNNQRAKIDRFGSDGSKMEEIEITQNGRRLFKYPSFLTQNSNGDICVSDLNRIVVTTNSGSFRYNYHGGKSKSFRPRGICCNIKLSHIIVADDINNIIHVVNENGTRLGVLDTSGQGILGQLRLPSSLSLDDNDNIWVGEMFSGLTKVLKYLELHYV